MKGGLIEGISYPSLSFLNNICFSGINWRRLIVSLNMQMGMLTNRLFGMYD